MKPDATPIITRRFRFGEAFVRTDAFSEFIGHCINENCISEVINYGHDGKCVELRFGDDNHYRTWQLGLDEAGSRIGEFIAESERIYRLDHAEGTEKTT